MNEFQRIVIEENRSGILLDLTLVDDIVTYLRSVNVLTEYDCESIRNSLQKGAKLLDVLHEKSGGPWFEEFCKALSNHYPWLEEKLLDEFRKEVDRKMEYYLQIRGKVPLLPQHNVNRSQYTKDLREEICQLNRQSYLVVHGMSGSGKTCLVTNALNDIHLLEKSLKGCVYWLSVGDLKDDDTTGELYCQQLLKDLCDMVSLNANPQKDLLSQLKFHFGVQQNYHALLVLHNVISPNVIKALDIGCKTLVTTNNIGVMNNVKERCKKLFPIQNGFTESESVKLLTDFVMEGKGELPPKIRQHAINVHQIWKGQPMVIGLVGGHLADKSQEARSSKACWEEFEKAPSQGNSDDNASRRRSLVEQQMSSVIEVTIDKLDPELKTLYEMLIVLVEDANITCDVLQTLWEKNRSDVEDIMHNFCCRSLAVKKHHPTRKVWIYGIHTLLIANVKSNFSPDELKGRHQDLLRKYCRKCETNFSQLPQCDNYIFTYICHHVDKAGEWAQYRDQFFSLRYLKSKLQATGPGDLLLDLHKYDRGLSDDLDNNKKKIADIINFVENSGWEIYKHHMDVKQCGLLEPKESIIYLWASQEGSNQSQTVLFYPLNNPKEKTKEIEMQFGSAKAVCIIPSSYSDGRVLIAPDKGFIAEVDMRFRSIRRYFEVDNVVLLHLSKYQDKFLSGSEDGFVKVWSLTLENINANTPPPSMRQKDYEDIHFSDVRTIPSMSMAHGKSVTSASFSHDGARIVSASYAGDVKVWNVETDAIEQTISVHPSPAAITCSFLPDDTMIVYGCGDYKVYFYDIQCGETKVIEEADRSHGRIITILPMTGETRKVIVVQLKAASLWSWDDQTLVHQLDGARRTEFRGLKKQLLHDETFSTITCAAYSEHRLVIGTSQRGCCCYFNINKFDGAVKETLIGSGMVKAIDLSLDRLVYFSGGCVHMCWPDNGNSSAKVNQNCIVHLGWTAREISIYASASGSGNLQVFRDGKLTLDWLKKDVSVLCISSDGNHLSFGTLSGDVCSIDLVSKEYLFSLRGLFPSEVLYLKPKVLNSRQGVLVAASYPISSSNADLEGEELCYIQVVGLNFAPLKCFGLTSRVVETFIYTSEEACLVAVSSDYSLKIWSLSSGRTCKPVNHLLQEGRSSAQVTGASISADWKLLVLSDEEKCFHVFTIEWAKESECSFKTISIIEQFKSLGLTLDIHKPNKYSTKNSLSPSASLGSLSPVDEIDGAVISTVRLLPGISLATYELSDAAWCCDMTCCGELVALGCGTNRVHIWSTAEKIEVAQFKVLPNSFAKVSHLKFSHSNMKISGRDFNLILLVVTDCFSLWDVSSLCRENSVKDPLTGIRGPTLLACVKARGLPFLEVSVCPSFYKFSGVDSAGSYFLWDIREEKERTKL